MKSVILFLALFMFAGISQVEAQSCPAFTSIFTQKFPCESHCQNCAWTFVGASTVSYQINGGSWMSLTPNTSISLDSGDVLCILGLVGPSIVCCYSHDEWCD